MKVVVIGDSDTAAGLRFAGIKDSFVVNTTEQAEQKLRKALLDQSVGLVILTERIADRLRQVITEFASQRTFPVIVEIPDKRGTEPGRRDPIKDIIRRAVGLEIKV